MGGTRIGLKVVGLMMTFGFIAVCLFWFKGPFNPMVYLYAILGIVGLFPMMIERFNWRVALINKLFFILALTGLIALIIAHDFDSIAFLSSSFVLFYAAGACYMMAITSDPRFAEMYMEHRDCYIVVKYRHNQTLPFVPGHLEWFLGLIIAPIKEAPVNSYRNAHTKFKTRTERVRFSCLSDAKSFASNMGSIVKNADSMEFISITFSNGLFWKNISKMKKTKSGSPSSKRPSFLTRVRSNANIHKASLIVCSIVLNCSQRDIPFLKAHLSN